MTMLNGKNNPIDVPHGKLKLLKEELNTSYNTLRKALSGKANTELQRSIRKAAIQCGGTEYKLLNNTQNERKN